MSQSQRRPRSPKQSQLVLNRRRKAAPSAEKPKARLASSSDYLPTLCISFFSQVWARSLSVLGLFIINTSSEHYFKCHCEYCTQSWIQRLVYFCYLDQVGFWFGLVSCYRLHWDVVKSNQPTCHNTHKRSDSQRWDIPVPAHMSSVTGGVQLLSPVSALWWVHSTLLSMSH